MLKRLLLGVLFALASCLFLPDVAHAQHREYHYNHVVIKNKSLVVGKNTNLVADASAHVEIGDTMSTRGILLHPTDTANIASPKFGTMIIQRSDSSMYIYTGDAWRKQSWTAP